MAGVYRDGNAGLGDQGVVIIDSDQSMVRLVRAPGRDAPREDPDLCEGMARMILQGYRQVIYRG